MDDTRAKLVDLCADLREVVQPFLGLHGAREHAGRRSGPAA